MMYQPLPIKPGRDAQGHFTDAKRADCKALLIEMMRAGWTVTKAIAAVGITKTTLYYWLDRDEDFQIEFHYPAAVRAMGRQMKINAQAERGVHKAISRLLDGHRKHPQHRRRHQPWYWDDERFEIEMEMQDEFI